MNGAEPDDRPHVVVEKISNALRITAVDQRAAKLSLAPGLTLADARARIPNIAVENADAKSDALLISHPLSSTRLVIFTRIFAPS